MREYADANGLRVSDFYSWKALLRRKGVLGEGESSSGRLFHKARVVDAVAGGRARITLRSGLRLELDAGAEPGWVAQLVLALERGHAGHR